MSAHLDAIRASCERARAAKAQGISVTQLLADRAGMTVEEFRSHQTPPRSNFLAGLGCRTCDGRGNYGRLGHMRCPNCG